MEADKALLTAEELACRLSLPPSWIYRRAKRSPDPMPSLRMGKYIRFKLEEVMKWLEDQQPSIGRRGNGGS